MIEDEDCEREKGTWMRVKEGVKVEGGDIVLVYPYVFAIRCWRNYRKAIEYSTKKYGTNKEPGKNELE